MKKALLIAGIDAVGITRLPQLFTRAGYAVDLLSSRQLAAAGSRLVSERIFCGPGPAAAAKHACEYLGQTGKKYDVIVLADEPTMWAALDGESTAWLRNWFPVSLEPRALGRLRSKIDFLVDSRAAGIRVPRFQICGNATELHEAAESIGFPLFVKETRGLAGSGLIYAPSRESLAQQIRRLSYEDPVVAQEEIVGKNGSISVLYEHGVPVCWFSYLMQQTWPNRFSSACTIRMFPHPDAEILVRAVGSLTGFHGLAGVDWMLDEKTNHLVLLEFNPRPTPVYHLGPEAGVDFARALAAFSEGGSMVQTPNLSARAIDLFPQSLYHAVEQGNAVQFVRAMGDAPWSDPSVVGAHFRRFITHYFPPGFKQYLHKLRGSGSI